MMIIDMISPHLGYPQGSSRGQLEENKHVKEENAMLREQLAQHHRQPAESSGSQNKRESPIPSTTKKDPNLKFDYDRVPLTANTIEPEITSPEADENAALRKEVDQFRQQHSQLLDQYSKLLDEMKRKRINSFEALAKQDKDLMEVLIELMKQTKPMPMEGNNIGLFGITSTGKSSLINAMLGAKLAEIGMGETTTRITPYQGNGYNLWDFPGRNDEVSYFSMEYISFLKGLSKRLIIIQATVKENSSLIRLLDANGLNYTIVVNKFDKLDEDERDKFQNQIRSEINHMDFKGVENVYFLSAKQPSMFPDWNKMINDVQNPST